MRISTKGRYALRLMLDVAASGGTGYVSLKDVAARQEISVKYLEQIAGSLSKAGMLRSSRGSQGGYQLTRPPEAYSLGDILRLTEGERAPVAGVEDQTAEGYAAEKHPKFEVYTDKAGEFRFRLKATNGQIIAVSEGYKAMASCLNGIESVKKNAADSPVVIAE